jgi:hypothetical protein
MDFLVNTDKLFNKMVIYVGIVVEMVSRGADVDLLKKEIVKFMDLSDVASLRSCQETLKAGERKGELCTNLSGFGEMYCGKHSNIKLDKLMNTKNTPQKVLLGNGKVIEKISDIDNIAKLEKDLKKNKKKINYIDTKEYGCRFTLSYHNYFNSKMVDKRCIREKEEARILGYIYSKILEDDETSIEEMIEIIYSRDWKYVDMRTAERGIRSSIIHQENIKKIRGETEKGRKITKDILKLKEVLISKMKFQESKKEYSKKTKEVIKVDNRIRGLSEEYSKNIIEELNSKVYLNYKKIGINKDRDVFPIKGVDKPNEKDTKRYMKNIKILDLKTWERSVYWNDAEQYAMKSGICNDEPTLNEIMKRKSGRGVTSSIIFPPLSYKETNHRNFYCQDVAENLFKPFFTVTCVESMPNFSEYGKSVKDHIYIRLEKMVKDKTYKRHEWQIMYHRLRLFYSKYLKLNTFHPEFLECREPMTMMRSARLLKANHEETIYALNLDIEYLDDIKYDLYKLMLTRGKTKSQELIVAIYEKFGINYLEQMIREVQMIEKKFGIKDIPENFYWMDPENPPDWIDVNILKTKRAGVRKYIDEQGIFQGKYDNKIDIVDEELFNILDPIQMYNLSKQGKLDVSPRKYASIKKRKALRNSNRELKICIIRDNKVIQEKDSFLYKARIEGNKHKEEIESRKIPVLAKVKDKMIDIPTIPLGNTKENGRDTDKEKGITIDERNLFTNFYREKMDSYKIIEPEILIDKSDMNNVISKEIVDGKIKYHIWEERLIGLIRNKEEKKRKEYVRINLEKRKEYIKRRNKEANYHYYNYRDMYKKEPILEEKYHDIEGIRGISHSEKDEINRVVGSIIEDVNHMMENIESNYDPNVCLEIFDNYKEIADETFKMFGRKMDGKLISEYSPRAKGNIEILNSRHLMIEKVENYKRCEEDFASEEYCNILEEYDEMRDRGLCGVIIH